jgi:hypothetical protein
MLSLDLVLKEVGSQGAFYEVLDGPNHLMWVATHVYGDQWLPKTPSGAFLCKRGLHTIPTGERFYTFEVMDVPGHTGILFVHPGNLPQKDSDGCFICGKSIGFIGKDRAVIVSRDCYENVFLPAVQGMEEIEINIKVPEDGLEN